MKNHYLLCILFIFTACANPPKEESTTLESLESTDSSAVAKKNENQSHFRHKLKKAKVDTSASEKHTTAELNDLSDFYQSLKKRPQVFRINSDSTQQIVCAEGTKIKIPHGAFETMNGNEVKGIVELRATEYYSNSDILKANLSTMSNGRMLESGGMINLEVFARGQKCRLKKGKELDITLSTIAEEEDMQTFYGRPSKSGINWLRRVRYSSRRLDKLKIYSVSKVDTAPQYPGGDQAIFKYIQDSMFYPYNALRRKIEGDVFVSWVVDTTGDVKLVVVHSRPRPSIDKVVVNLISKLPKYKPAWLNGKKVPVRYFRPIKFSLSKSQKQNANYELEEKAKLLEKKMGHIKVSYYSKLPLYLKTTEQSNTGYAQKLKEGNGTDSLNANASEDVNYYTISSEKLGWINCDRFLDEPNLSDFYVELEGEDQNISVKMIFKDIKSILSANNRGDRYGFKDVPEGKEVTLLSIKEIGGQYYVALKETNITNNSTISLEFEKVTVDRLKELMESLDA